MIPAPRPAQPRQRAASQTPGGELHGLAWARGSVHGVARGGQPGVRQGVCRRAGARPAPQGGGGAGGGGPGKLAQSQADTLTSCQVG